MFTLAHFTDPHIGPLPEPNWLELMGKRLSGYLSWTGNRHNIHKMDILAALVTDLKAQHPDHVALTGDIINISLKAEFANASLWLRDTMAPDKMSLVPGNHDTYVKVSWRKGLGLWSDYMSSDPEASSYLKGIKTPFPFLRLRGKIAIIGLSSAEPTAPFMACGHIGHRQLKHLDHMLQNLGDGGFFRVVLIHHPPLPGKNSHRKGLWDARDLTRIFKKHGPELVLHGHNHKPMLTMLETRRGLVPVVGAPSASARATGRHPAAGYSLFSISNTDGRWQCAVQTRKPKTGHSGFEKTDALFPPHIYG